MELKEIQDLIKFVAKSGVEEVELEQGSFKITIKAKSSPQVADNPAPQYMIAPSMMPNNMQQIAATAQQTSQPTPSTEAVNKPSEAEAPKSSNLIEIKAPMIGTFYRASGPDKEAFAKVGDSIQKGQTVCIIEAMKLFNEIESEVSGKIVKVLVDDTAPVEYDQPLFLIDPA